MADAVNHPAHYAPIFDSLPIEPDTSIFARETPLSTFGGLGLREDRKRQSKTLKKRSFT